MILLVVVNEGEGFKKIVYKGKWFIEWNLNILVEVNEAEWFETSFVDVYSQKKVEIILEVNECEGLNGLGLVKFRF